MTEITNKEPYSEALHGGKENAERKLQDFQCFLKRLDRQVKRGLISTDERVILLATLLLRLDSTKKEAQEEALTDKLTGLQNRRAFDNEYEKLVQTNKPFGLLLLDIDLFKEINDKYGHTAGDSAISQVGLLLELNVRGKNSERDSHDVVSRLRKTSRLGGDEFAILLPDISSPDDLKIVAERIRKSIEDEPIQLNSEEGKPVQHQLNLSIGGSVFTSGENARDFFNRVDTQALYKAKDEQGERNKVVIIEPKKLIDKEAA